MKRIFLIGGLIVSAVCFSQTKVSSLKTDLNEPAKQEVLVEVDVKQEPVDVKSETGLNDAQTVPVNLPEKKESQPTVPPKAMSSDIDKPN